MKEPTAHRQVARRDGALEGDPDPEPSAHEKGRPMKDAQRDLTSLSGPVERDEERDEPS